MKKILLIAAILLVAVSVEAQEKSSNIKFELGKGLNISFNNEQHNVYLGGYVQSNAIYEYIKGDENNRFNLGVKRAYLALGGNFYENKLSFFLQMNYVDSYPLLDAWIAYQPLKQLKITVGQKQSFASTRSMMFYDYALALGDRGISDRTFFGSGREFGIFAESRLPFHSTGFDLGLAITSGDGRNAFGATSSYSDKGGLKYSGRATFYPLGFFTKGNELTGTDFAREKSVKIAVGGSYSYNDGASNRIGDGSGDFLLYNENGRVTYPGYQKITADVLVKYNGFTFLAEMTNASAKNLSDIYVTPTPVGKLRPREIANYLTLGNGYNVQAGYLFKNNWAVDARYGIVTPEWSSNQTQITKTEAYTLGGAKYFIDNRLKLQMTLSYQNQPELVTNRKRVAAEFTAHIVF